MPDVLPLVGVQWHLSMEVGKLKIDIIDMTRNLVIDTIESEVMPRVGEKITMSSGMVLVIAKARNNIPKKVMEAHVQLPLKHHIFPNNKPPYSTK